MSWTLTDLTQRQRELIADSIANNKQAWLNDTRIKSDMLEAPFQEIIIELATLRGWDWIWHDVDSRKNEANKPDLELGRSKTEQYLQVELKRNGKNPRPGQREAIAKLKKCGLDVRVWKPKDWTEIVNFLW